MPRFALSSIGSSNRRSSLVAVEKSDSNHRVGWVEAFRGPPSRPGGLAKPRPTLHDVQRRHGGRMKPAIVIPARYASSRLPAKPLLCETGKYLIQHVYEQATASQA